MIDIVLKAAASVEIQAENEWLIAHLNENRQKCQRTVGCCLDAMKLIVGGIFLVSMPFILDLCWHWHY